MAFKDARQAAWKNMVCISASAGSCDRERGHFPFKARRSQKHHTTLHSSRDQVPNLILFLRIDFHRIVA
jgi:hypothetical protein